MNSEDAVNSCDDELSKSITQPKTEQDDNVSSCVNILSSPPSGSSSQDVSFSHSELNSNSFLSGFNVSSFSSTDLNNSKQENSIQLPGDNETDGRHYEVMETSHSNEGIASSSACFNDRQLSTTLDDSNIQGTTNPSILTNDSQDSRSVHNQSTLDAINTSSPSCMNPPETDSLNNQSAISSPSISCTNTEHLIMMQNNSASTDIQISSMSHMYSKEPNMELNQSTVDAINTSVAYIDNEESIRLVNVINSSSTSQSELSTSFQDLSILNASNKSSTSHIDIHESTPIPNQSTIINTSISNMNAEESTTVQNLSVVYAINSSSASYIDNEESNAEQHHSTVDAINISVFHMDNEEQNTLQNQSTVDAINLSSASHMDNEESNAVQNQSTVDATSTSVFHMDNEESNAEQNHPTVGAINLPSANHMDNEKLNTVANQSTVDAIDTSVFHMDDEESKTVQNQSTVDAINISSASHMVYEESNTEQKQSTVEAISTSSASHMDNKELNTVANQSTVEAINTSSVSHLDNKELNTEVNQCTVDAINTSVFHMDNEESNTVHNQSTVDAIDTSSATHMDNEESNAVQNQSFVDVTNTSSTSHMHIEESDTVQNQSTVDAINTSSTPHMIIEESDTVQNQSTVDAINTSSASHMNNEESNTVQNHSTVDAINISSASPMDNEESNAVANQSTVDGFNTSVFHMDYEESSTVQNQSIVDAINTSSASHMDNEESNAVQNQSTVDVINTSSTPHMIIEESDTVQNQSTVDAVNTSSASHMNNEESNTVQNHSSVDAINISSASRMDNEESNAVANQSTVDGINTPVFHMDYEESSTVQNQSIVDAINTSSASHMDNEESNAVQNQSTVDVINTSSTPHMNIEEFDTVLNPSTVDPINTSSASHTNIEESNAVQDHSTVVAINISSASHMDNDESNTEQKQSTVEAINTFSASHMNNEELNTVANQSTVDGINTSVFHMDYEESSTVQNQSIVDAINTSSASHMNNEESNTVQNQSTVDPRNTSSTFHMGAEESNVVQNQSSVDVINTSSTAHTNNDESNTVQNQCTLLDEEESSKGHNQSAIEVINSSLASHKDTEESNMIQNQSTVNAVNSSLTARMNNDDLYGVQNQDTSVDAINISSASHVAKLKLFNKRRLDCTTPHKSVSQQRNGRSEASSASSPSCDTCSAFIPMNVSIGEDGNLCGSTNLFPQDCSVIQNDSCGNVGSRGGNTSLDRTKRKCTRDISKGSYSPSGINLHHPNAASTSLRSEIDSSLAGFDVNNSHLSANETSSFCLQEMFSSSVAGDKNNISLDANSSSRIGLETSCTVMERSLGLASIFNQSSVKSPNISFNMSSNEETLKSGCFNNSQQADEVKSEASHIECDSSEEYIASDQRVDPGELVATVFPGLCSQMEVTCLDHKTFLMEETCLGEGRMEETCVFRESALPQARDDSTKVCDSSMMSVSLATNLLSSFKHSDYSFGEEQQKGLDETIVLPQALSNVSCTKEVSPNDIIKSSTSMNSSIHNKSSNNSLTIGQHSDSFSLSGSILVEVPKDRNIHNLDYVPGEDLGNNMDITELEGGCEGDLEQSLDLTCKPDGLFLANHYHIPPKADGLEMKSQIAPGRDSLSGAMDTSLVDSDGEKLAPLRESLDELQISGCAMDYTLSASLCTPQPSSQVENIHDNISPQINSVDGGLSNTVLEKTSCDDYDNLEISMSKLGELELSYSISDTSCTNIAEKTTDIRRMLSDTVNRSISLGKKIPDEDVQSMKDNLFLVMDLLEKENNEFEQYKITCESDKIKLLAEIDELKNLLSAKNNDNHEEKSQTSFEEVVNMLVLTESDIAEFNSISFILNSLNIGTEKLVLEDKQVIQPKNVLNALQSLIEKYDLLKSEYSRLLERQGNEMKALNIRESERESSKADNEKQLEHLEAECQQLRATLLHNVEQCKLLQETNLIFTKDLSTKDQEIINLQNEIKIMTNEMNLFKESKEIEIEELGKKYSELESKLIDLQTTNENLMKENICHEEGKDLVTLLEKERDSLRLKLFEVESDLGASEESRNGLESRYNDCVSELSGLKVSQESLNRELEHFADRCRESNVSLKSREQEIAELKCLLSALQEESYFKGTQLQQCLEQIEEMATSYRNEKDHHMYLINEEQSKYDEVMKLNSDLRDENTAIKNELDELRKANSLYEKENASILEKCNVLESKLSELEELASEYTRFKELHDSCDRVKALLEEKEIQWNALVSEYDKFVGEMNSLNNMMKKSEENVRQIEEQYNLLKISFDEQSKLLEEKIQTIESLEQCEKQLNIRLICTNTMLKEAEETNIILRNEYKELNSSHERVNMRNNALNLECSDLKMKYDNILASLNTVREELDKITETNEKYSKDIDALNQEIADLSKKLDDSQVKYCSIKEDYDRQEITLESVRKDHDELKAQYEESLRNSAELTELYSREMEKNLKLNDQLAVNGLSENELKDSLEKLKVDYRDSLSKYEEMRASKELLQSDYSKLEETYDVAAEKINNLLDILSEKESLIDEKTRELTSTAIEMSLVKEQLSDLNSNYDYECTRNKVLEEDVMNIKKHYEECMDKLVETDKDRSLKAQTIQQLESTISLLNQEKHDAMENLSALKSDYESLEQRLESENSTLKSVREEYSQLQHAFSQIQDKLDQLEKTCLEKENALKNYGSENVEMGSELVSLKERLVTLEKEHEDIHSQLKDRCEEVSRLESELAESKAICSAAASDVERLEAEKQAAGEGYQLQMQALQEEFISLKESLVGLEKEHDGICSQLKDRCEEVNRLEGELSESQAKCALVASDAERLEAEKQAAGKGYQLQMEALQEELISLKESLAGLEKENEEVCSQLKDKCEEVSRLEGELSEAQAKCAHVESDVERLEAEKRAANEGYQLQVQTLQEELVLLKESQAGFEKEHEVVCSQLKDKCEEVSRLEGELSEYQAKYTLVASDAERLEAEKQAAGEGYQLQMQALQEELVSLKESLAGLEKEHEEVCSQLKDRCEEVNRLEGELSESQAKCALLGSDAERLEAEKQAAGEGYQLQMQALQEESVSFKESLVCLEKELEAVRCQLKDKCEEVSRLEGELAESSAKYAVILSDVECLEVEKHAASEDYQQQIQLIQDQLLSLQQEYTTLSNDYTQALAKYESKSSEVLSLETVKDELNSKYSELLKHCESLESQLETKEKENSSLTLDLTKMNNLILDLKNEQNELSLQNQHKLESLQVEYDNLSAEYNIATAKIHKLEKELVVNIESNEHLNTRFTKADEDIKNMNVQLSNLTDDYKILKCKYEEENAKVDRLEKELGEVSRKYKETLTDLERTSDDCIEKAEETDRLCKELVALKDQLALSNQTASDLQTKYQELLDQHQSQCPKAISDLNDKYETVLKSLKISEEDISGKGKLIEELESQLTLSNAEFSTLNNNYIELKTKYQEGQEKLEEEGIRSNGLLVKLNELESNLAATTSDLDKIQKDYAEKELENDSLKENRKAMENDLLNLKNSLDMTQEKLTQLKAIYQSQNEEYNSLKNEIENLLKDKEMLGSIEKDNAELKTQYAQLQADFSKKVEELCGLHEIVEKLEVEKCSLECEKEKLNEEHSKCKDVLKDLSCSLEKSVESVKSLDAELKENSSKLTSSLLKLEKYSHYEDVINNYKNEYSFFSSKFDECKDNFLLSEHQTFDTFFACTEAMLNEMTRKDSEMSELKNSLLKKHEELEEKTSEINSLSTELKDLKLKSSNDYSLLQNNYDELIILHNNITVKYDETLGKCEQLKLDNDDLKNEGLKLREEISEKDKLLSELRSAKDDYVAVSAENRTLTKELTEKTSQAENLKGVVSNYEGECNSLKMQIQEMEEKLENIQTENCRLKVENENYALVCSNTKQNLEKQEKDYEALRHAKMKCEKEYQNVFESLKRTREEMYSMEKKVEEKMARFTYVLKEKESFENKNLSLLKDNDELTNKIKELTMKLNEYEKSYSKALQLESELSKVSQEKAILEKQLTDYDKFRRESTHLKAELAVKDSQIHDLKVDCKNFKTNYQQKCDESKELLEKLTALFPGTASSVDFVKAVENTFSQLKALQEELNEEKTKSENLDEECNLLNEDLKYKERIIGDMYKEHSEELDSLKQTLESTENKCKIVIEENVSLKSNIQKLETAVISLKSAEPAPCTTCMDLKKTVDKSKMEVAECNSKISTLQQDMDQQQVAFKKKLYEYRKKVQSLQTELGSAVEKAKEREKKECADTGAQTEPLPLQLTGQAGIVQSLKLKEQEEKIHKIEKENVVLKKVCHNRLQTIKDLQAKLEAPGSSAPKKQQRAVLEEIKNN